ncbi:MAG TPA: biotin transporter BioY [Vicinamibacterales bacterium]
MTTRLLPANPPSAFVAAIASGTDNGRAIRVAAVLLVTALTAAAAQISVPLPFTPVPLTLQPMIVLLGGVALGSSLGMSSQILYLALGVIGLPVFAASPLLPQGLLRLFGPTGGYLLSYPVAAFLAGWLAERGLDRRYLGSVVAMAAGLAVIYLGGIAGLLVFAPGVHAAGFAAILAAAVYPFLALDIVKLFVAAGVMPGLWKLTGLRR